MKNLVNWFVHTSLGEAFCTFLIGAVGKSILSCRSNSLVKFDLMRLRARRYSSRNKLGSIPEKLHLGCGSRRLPGWLNVDVACSDFNVDLTGTRLPFPDNTFQTVVCQQVIEHLELFEELLPLLRELRRISKPDCEIWLACPDLERICASYVQTRGSDLLDDRVRRGAYNPVRAGVPVQWVINWQFHQAGNHKNLFDFEILRWAVESARLGQCTRSSESELLHSHPDFPLRDDDLFCLYVRIVVNKSEA